MFDSAVILGLFILFVFPRGLTGRPFPSEENLVYIIIITGDLRVAL